MQSHLVLDHFQKLSKYSLESLNAPPPVLLSHVAIQVTVINRLSYPPPAQDIHKLETTSFPLMILFEKGTWSKTRPWLQVED